MSNIDEIKELLPKFFEDGIVAVDYLLDVNESVDQKIEYIRFWILNIEDLKNHSMLFRSSQKPIRLDQKELNRLYICLTQFVDELLEVVS